MWGKFTSPAVSRYRQGPEGGLKSKPATTEGCVATQRKIFLVLKFYLVSQTALLICNKFNPFQLNLLGSWVSASAVRESHTKGFRDAQCSVTSGTNYLRCRHQSSDSFRAG